MTAVTDEIQARNDADMTAKLEAAEGSKATVHVVGGDSFTGNVKQAASKNGTRRFQVGRRIVSVDTVVRVDRETPQGDPVTNGQPSSPGSAANPSDALKAPGGGGKNPVTSDDRAPDEVKPAKAPAEKVTLTSGAVVTGKTVTIRCAWVAPENRTKAQQKLFETNFLGVEPGKGYEAMVKAAGNGAGKDAAMPDGTERTIKVQDAFQVRFSVDNQKRHRNEQRRRKAQQRRAQREAAKAAKS